MSEGSSLQFTRRPHGEGDDARLLELLRLAFGEWPHVEIQVDPIDHLRWKLDGPGDAKGLHRITEVDGHLASSTFCIVQWVKAGDGMLYSIQGTDSCVHPDFQGHGLSEAIRNWRRAHPDDQKSDIQFGVRSPHPAMRKASKRMSGVQWIGNELQALSLDPRAAPPARGGMRVMDVDCFDERIDRFWHEAAAPYDLILQKTAEYMNWRYMDPRAGIFSGRIVEERGEIAGYAVLRSSRGKGYIADLLALPERPDVVRALLDDASAHFVARGALRLDYWLPAHHPYQGVAADVGFAFRSTPTIVQIYLRNPEVDLTFLDDPLVHVHICAGDTDLI